MILRGLYGVWIISYVACLIAFMSMFFSSRKNVFKKACTTPPRHLAICQASKLFFLITISTSSTPDGSIEKVTVSLIATARSINRATILDMVVSSSTLAQHLHLSTAIFSTPTSTACSMPLYTYIYRDLLMAYIFSSCDPQLISIDLFLDASVFSTPKPLSLTPIFFLKVSSSFFKIFFTW